MYNIHNWICIFLGNSFPRWQMSRSVVPNRWVAEGWLWCCEQQSQWFVEGSNF